MRAAVLLLLFTTIALPVGAQTTTSDVTIPPPRLKTVSLSGPRFGVTALSDGSSRNCRSDRSTCGSSITQFGWQFEKEFYSKEGGVAALHEFVFLARRPGAGRGAAEPELAGRTANANGAEFGIGPNITPAGVALTLAAGVTFRSGALNVPMTFASSPRRRAPASAC